MDFSAMEIETDKTKVSMLSNSYDSSSVDVTHISKPPLKTLPQHNFVQQKLQNLASM